MPGSQKHRLTGVVEVPSVVGTVQPDGVDAMTLPIADREERHARTRQDNRREQEFTDHFRERSAIAAVSVHNRQAVAEIVEDDAAVVTPLTAQPVGRPEISDDGHGTSPGRRHLLQGAV